MEEDAGVYAVHEVEIHFDLFEGVLGSASYVGGEVCHFGSFLGEGLGGGGGGGDAPLRGDGGHFFGGAGEDAVTDFVGVGPFGAGG